MITYIVKKPFRYGKKVYLPHERINVDPKEVTENFLERLQWATKWRFVVPIEKSVAERKKEMLAKKKEEANKKKEELKTQKDELKKLEGDHKKAVKDIEAYDKAIEKKKKPKISEDEYHQSVEGIADLENGIETLKAQIEEQETK